MKVLSRIASAACALALLPASAQTVTPRLPVADTYHGVKVVDDYRWLENGENPRVRAWSDAQNARARAFLDALPGREALAAEIERLVTSRPPAISRPVVRGGKTFAVCFDPARRQQPWIVLLPNLATTDGMRAVVDPNALDPSGRTAFDWFVPSPDGGRIAVSLSQGGSEEGTLHVFDVATGRETGDVIPLVQKGTAGGSAAWTADGAGLFYTRYPRAGERAKEDLDFYQQVFFHALGTPVPRRTATRSAGSCRASRRSRFARARTGGGISRSSRTATAASSRSTSRARQDGERSARSPTASSTPASVRTARSGRSRAGVRPGDAS